MFRSILTAALLVACAAPAVAADWSLVNIVETPATTADAVKLKKGTADSANLNRFGFYSDLVWMQPAPQARNASRAC